MPNHVYLRKHNDQLVSHCRCAPAEALISSPAQMDCPWCGCGWLFTCTRCRKAFTFAEGVEVDGSWEQTADRSIRALYRREPEPDEAAEWVGFMKLLLRDVVPGEAYVYLDGWVLPAAEATRVAIDGWHSRHDLDVVPQVAALRDRSFGTGMLESREYWRSTALERDDDDD